MRFRSALARSAFPGPMPLAGLPLFEKRLRSKRKARRGLASRALVAGVPQGEYRACPATGCNQIPVDRPKQAGRGLILETVGPAEAEYAPVNCRLPRRAQYLMRLQFEGGLGNAFF